MSSLPRMRDARGVLEEIKRIDPETPITLNFVRGMIRSRDVPVVEAGNRKFVNVDNVLEFLAQKSTVNPVRYVDRTGAGTPRLERE